MIWGDTALGVNTANGVLFGNQIQWGNVDPDQVLWLLPPAGGASSNTIMLLSR